MVFFNIFAQNINCGDTLEMPQQGGSNEYPQSMFWSKNAKNRYTSVYPFHYKEGGYTFHVPVFLITAFKWKYS